MTEQEATQNGFDLQDTNKDTPECAPDASVEKHSQNITELSYQPTKDSPSQSTASKQIASESSSHATLSSARVRQLRLCFIPWLHLNHRVPLSHWF